MPMLQLIVSICFVLGLTFQAAAQSSTVQALGVQCSTGQLKLADLNALKLPEGEQVIGMLETEYGKLEARVDVNGGIVADPKYYIRGKLLTVSPESKIPKPLRACVAPGKRSSAGGTGSASLLNWIVRSAEAMDKRRCIVIASGCFGGVCCAYGCCSGSCATACAFY